MKNKVIEVNGDDLLATCPRCMSKNIRNIKHVENDEGAIMDELICVDCAHAWIYRRANPKFVQSEKRKNAFLLKLSQEFEWENKIWKKIKQLDFDYFQRWQRWNYEFDEKRKQKRESLKRHWATRKEEWRKLEQSKQREIERIIYRGAMDGDDVKERFDNMSNMNLQYWKQLTKISNLFNSLYVYFKKHPIPLLMLPRLQVIYDRNRNFFETNEYWYNFNKKDLKCIDWTKERKELWTWHMIIGPAIPDNCGYGYVEEIAAFSKSEQKDLKYFHLQEFIEKSLLNLHTRKNTEF